MLHITAILEDTQIVLTYDDATRNWHGTFADGCTGRSAPVQCDSTEASAIFALALHGDGEPQGFEKFYEVLADFLQRNGMNEGEENVVLRPVP